MSKITIFVHILYDMTHYSESLHYDSNWCLNEPSFWAHNGILFVWICCMFCVWYHTISVFFNENDHLFSEIPSSRKHQGTALAYFYNTLHKQRRRSLGTAPCPPPMSRKLGVHELASPAMIRPSKKNLHLPKTTSSTPFVSMQSKIIHIDQIVPNRDLNWSPSEEADTLCTLPKKISPPHKSFLYNYYI